MAKKVFDSLSNCMMETIRILDDLSGKQQMERILHNITQILYEKTSCQTSAVIRLQAGNERLEIVNSYGLSWQFCKNYRRNEVNTRVREFLWQENPLLISNVDRNDPVAAAYQLEHPFRSCYCLPLMTNKQPVGYLHLDSENANHFSSDDQLLAQLYSKIISVTILKTNLLTSLEHRSERDHETGAIVYDIFYSRLDESLAKANRQGEKLSLILIDVAKFDQLLTSFGDKTCKELMKELIIIIRNSLRTYDAISQFGADEVIIILPGHSLEEADGCTRKLYDIIRKKKFTDKKLNIDVSIGIAGFPEHAHTAGGLVTASKNALVESKRSSDHRITLAGNFYQ